MVKVDIPATMIALSYYSQKLSHRYEQSSDRSFSTLPNCSHTDFSFLVAIYASIQDSNNNKTVSTLLCAGSLLTVSWVLTAASCAPINETDRTTFRVMAGGKLTEWEPSDMVQVVNGKTLIRHEKFDPVLLLNDIAVLELERKITLNANISIAHLSNTQKKGFTFNCSSNHVAGWGEMSIPRELKPLKCPNVTMTPLIGICEVQENMKKAYKMFNLTNLQGIISGTGDESCAPESGAPLVCEGMVVGVASGLFIPECRKNNSCTHYTTVEAYFGFIKNHTGMILPNWDYRDPEYAIKGAHGKLRNRENIDFFDRTVGLSKRGHGAGKRVQGDVPVAVLVFLIICWYLYNK